MVVAAVTAAAGRGTDMRASRAVLPLLISLCLAAGCGGKKQEPAAGSTQPAPAAKVEPKKAEPPPKAAQSADFQRPLVETLKKGGLTVGDFESTAAKPYQARACTRGEVSKLDVMACQYESEQGAEQAKAALEQFVGGAGTGAVRRSGNVALAVADRTKIDPRGKLVDKVLKTFSGQAPAQAPAAH